MAPLANLLLLTVSVEFLDATAQGRIWLVFIFNLGFSLIFGLSAYGLWQQRNWGRLLFMGGLAVWAVFNLTALLAPGNFFSTGQDFTAGERLLNGLRHLIGLILPLWYLNLSQIKAIFQTEKL